MDYKQTLNLPSTKFPMKGNLVKREPEMLKNWYKHGLYQLIRAKKANKNIFFIHDGPPYANGGVHIGHALNKILKDIITKSKGLMGYNSPYLPGWDCHGLPIELKVEELISKSNLEILPKKFRCMCRKYALSQIKGQKKDFIRLGVLGDWEHAYSTMDFLSEANIVRCLSQVINQGYIYRDIKPIYWCIKCSSVLSEAEVEYSNNHVSPSIYVEFVATDSNRVALIFGIKNFKDPISLIVWNTTPWTLPGNRALAVNPSYDYCFAKISKKYYIFAFVLLKNILNCLNSTDYKIFSLIKGKNLEFLFFRHPFMSFDVPIVLAEYVLSTVGSGVVHIAPGHGVDDYEVARKYGLEVFNLIDSLGCYKSNILPDLNTLQLSKVNDIVISLLKRYGHLLYFEKIEHSYPYCWRHKTPVIFRATFQWFINLNHCDLRLQCLEKIDKMHWIPPHGKSNIRSMLINRPDWCISRQRLWGVPITVFLHKETGHLHPRTVELMEIIAKRIEKGGVQAWWDLDVEDIIGADDAIQYEKVFDVLDVWFDSGSTYFSSVISRSEFKNHIPDIYLEGSDQYRGWFMSSLLLSVIITGKVPCRTIVSHGFSVDVQGRKMSKSVGNVISPKEIINKFGADVLRLWIASTDYTTEIVFSEENITCASIAYRRIRNTIRFILGNLSDFHPKQHIIDSNNMLILDRWVVARALSIQSEIISDYQSYNFHKIVQRIMYFCSIELGSFYLDVIKDRQYVLKQDSVARRSSQNALYHIIEAMVRWIAPIMSFTADEIWQYIPGKRSLHVFFEEWYGGLFAMDSSHSMDENYWNMFLKVRTEVNKVIEKARENGYIKSSLEASLILYTESELAKLLKQLGDEVRFGFLVSSVIIEDYTSLHGNNIHVGDAMQGLKIYLEKAKGEKCSRCWHYTLNVGICSAYPDICSRCIENVFGCGEIRKFI